jgi:hypothetical protein
MSREHLTLADSFFVGKVTYPPVESNKPGVAVDIEFNFHNYGVIVLADANGAIETQDLTALGVYSGAGIAGALAAGGVATFDTPRNVVAAWTGAAVITVTGTDLYGAVLKESSASGTSLTGKKAFKTVTAVAVSADVTGLTVGSGVVIGLPHRVDVNALIIKNMDNAITTGTFVPAVTTDPATATTGDVRGTISFGSAPDDTRTYAVMYKIAGSATKLLAYGVDQYDG